MGRMTRLPRVVTVGVPRPVTQRGSARQFILGAAFTSFEFLPE
jgi:hypothetical protein